MFNPQETRNDMIQIEAQLEQQFIEKLQELKYTYRSDIRDLDSLEQNFREKFQRLNYVTLSDDEFRKLLQQNISSDVFSVSKHLREKQTFVRNDGTTFEYSLVNIRDWCKNDFEIVSQLSINTANSRQRYDVIILINGLPLVQIELKRHNTSPRKAVGQIIRYKQERGNGYLNTLMCFMQLFIVSNGAETMYFANNNDEHFQFDAANNYLSVYYAADSDNHKVGELFDFSNMMLQKGTLGRLISRYMVLVETEKKILVMRPYQIYAVESIVNTVIQNNQNGYVWHTTGSGKTLTSFKASTLLKDIDEIQKCVFVVDRKDLDKQTRDEFNKFQEGCVEQNVNTAALVSRLESDDYADKVIVTTIQKLGIALKSTKENKYYQRLLRLRDQRIVFIFDECHRSQFGENHKAIKEFFPKAQLFGFTGTPIFEENSHTVRITGQMAENVTTKDVFDKCLHKYTIVHAINDDNVLRFNVQTFCNKSQDGEVDSKPLTKNQIIEHILNNHDRVTAQRRFNALLATPSIPDAIRYYKMFKEEQEKLAQANPDYEPLNITAVFTPPMSKQYDDEDLPTETEDNQKNPHENKSALSEIIKDYNAQFGTNFSVELFDEYYRDVQQRIKDQKYPNKDLPHSKKLDIVIVVEMMLTGFDSKFLNTLYVAKELKHHGLIQAFSRTNRILDGTKPYGNIICYRNLEAELDEAMLMFSGEDKNKAKEYWLVDSPAKVVEEYQNAISQLETVMNGMGLDCQPEEVINIPQGENSTRFIEAFKDVQRLALKLDQYVDLPEDLQTAIEEAMPEDTLQQFRTAYIELAHKTRTAEPGSRTEFTPEDDVDYELSLFSSALVDYDYIMRLLARYTDTHFERVKLTREQLLDILSGSVDLMNEREYLQAFINEELQQGSGINEMEIRRLYKEFKNRCVDQKIAQIAEQFGVNHEVLESFVVETVKLRRIDENVFYEMLSHIDNWKQRKAAKEGLLANLKPLFDLMSGGYAIEGLSAYVKQ